MRVVSAMQEQFDMRAAAAFIVYIGNQRACATHHEIEQAKDGTLTIQPGVPATVQSFAEAARLMIGEERPRALLPEGLLAHDSDFLLWYRPSARRTIYFRTGNKHMDAVDGKHVLHPALLFVVSDLRLYIFALDGDARPGVETRLYRAPYYNMFHSGMLCEGDFKMPEHYRVDGIEQWEQGFFDTSFAHTHMAVTDVTRHPDGHLGLWRELAVDVGRKTLAQFPVQHLVPLTELMVTLDHDDRAAAKAPPLTLGRLLKHGD